MGATAIGDRWPPKYLVGRYRVLLCHHGRLNGWRGDRIAVPAALWIKGWIISQNSDDNFCECGWKYSEKGNNFWYYGNGSSRKHCHGLSTAIPVFVALVLGQDAVAAAKLLFPKRSYWDNCCRKDPPRTWFWYPLKHFGIPSFYSLVLYWFCDRGVCRMGCSRCFTGWDHGGCILRFAKRWLEPAQFYG